MFTEENTNGIYTKDQLETMNNFLDLCITINEADNLSCLDFDEAIKYYSERIINLL